MDSPVQPTATQKDKDKDKDKDKEKKKKRTSVKKVKDKTEQQSEGVSDEVQAEEEMFAVNETEVLNDDVTIKWAEPPGDDHHLKPERRSSAMEIIGEILSPSLKVRHTGDAYSVPKAVEHGDADALQELDERKLIELREVFTLFDSDGDGCISEGDLRRTFAALGQEVPNSTIKEMLSEAFNPLNFDAFVILMGYRTIELDPEDVLIEAWSKWDPNETGCVSEEKMFHDLITYGDKFTEKEAVAALKDAPMVKPKKKNDSPMIDYQSFCRSLCGLRKRRKY